MRVRACFIHPESGMQHVITNVESVESFREKLKKRGCCILFVEEELGEEK